MLNIASLFIGAIAILLAIPAAIPLLGWANWFILPLPLIGLALGVLSRRTGGRNLNIAALLFIAIRLSIGGGIF